MFSPRRNSIAQYSSLGSISTFSITKGMLPLSFTFSSGYVRSLSVPIPGITVWFNTEMLVLNLLRKYFPVSSFLDIGQRSDAVPHIGYVPHVCVLRIVMVFTWWTLRVSWCTFIYSLLLTSCLITPSPSWFQSIPLKLGIRRGPRSRTVPPCALHVHQPSSPITSLRSFSYFPPPIYFSTFWWWAVFLVPRWFWFIPRSGRSARRIPLFTRMWHWIFHLSWIVSVKYAFL